MKELETPLRVIFIIFLTTYPYYSEIAFARNECTIYLLLVLLINRKMRFLFSFPL